MGLDSDISRGYNLIANSNRLALTIFLPSSVVVPDAECFVDGSFGTGLHNSALTTI